MGRLYTKGNLSVLFGNEATENFDLIAATDTFNPRNPLSNKLFIQQEACRTSVGASPTSCTSCPKKASGSVADKHITILTPATSSGTCTTNPRQYYRQQECCKKDEKHYVLSAADRMGVCVRQDDDCAPVCVPRDLDPSELKLKVCSKGCNILHMIQAKWDYKGERNIPKDRAYKGTELNRLFEMVVCDSRKQVYCTPPTTKTKLTNGARLSCVGSQAKTVRASVRCQFDPAVWALGGTCIASVFFSKVADASLVAFASKNFCKGNAASTLQKIKKICTAIPQAAKHSMKDAGDLCAPVAMSY